MSKAGAREAILDTAERLFAEQGLDAVSLRTINTEAGYSVAALHYHFGTRDQLLEALFDRRRDTVLSSRQALLERLQKQKKPRLRAIAEALVLPLAELVFADPEAGLRTVKFFFRTYVDRRGNRRTQKITEQSYQIFDELLARAAPAIDPKVMHKRWLLATELAFQGLANMDSTLATDGAAPTIDSYQEYTELLIDFVAAGLGAKPRD